MAEKVYECTNKDCILGAPGQSGFFTGGMTQQLKAAKTGMPFEHMEQGKDYGEGVCPECGKQAKNTGAEHVSLVGDDPHDKLHQEANAKTEKEIAEINDKYAKGEIDDSARLTMLAVISDEAQQHVIEGANT